MAQQSACRGHQDDLAAIALRFHLLGRGARHEPALRDIGVHDTLECRRLHILDLGNLVHARRDDQDVEPTKFGNGFRDHVFACGFTVGAALDLECFARTLGRDFGHGIRVARCQRQLAPGGRQRLGGNRPKRTRRAGDERNFSADVKKGMWIREAHFGRPPSG